MKFMHSVFGSRNLFLCVGLPARLSCTHTCNTVSLTCQHPAAFAVLQHVDFVALDGIAHCDGPPGVENPG
jgi:hypothetical protein